VVAGSGIFDSLLKFLVRTFTSQAAKKLLLPPQEVGKAALEVGKTVAADTGKKLIEKVMQPKAKNKIENIVSKYTDQSMKDSAVAIQDLVKKTEWFRIERDIIKRCKKKYI